jgi:hypothetical protein
MMEVSHLRHGSKIISGIIKNSEVPTESTSRMRVTHFTVWAIPSGTKPQMKSYSQEYFFVRPRRS